MKECINCKKTKSINDFYKRSNSKDGHTNMCKFCYNEKRIEWRKNNPEKHRAQWKKYHKNNKKKYNSSCKKYAQNNPEKIFSKNKRWTENNPKKVLATRKRYREKNRLNNRISEGLRQALQNMKRGRHWEKLVGYSLIELRKHLEKKFKPGMAWGNIGKWHIDHIIPKSFWEFKTHTDREFKQCWALANLQPLWAIENLQKSNKI